MRLTSPDFGPVVLGDLHTQIAALSIPGFTGLSLDGAGLHVEFPDVEGITAEEHTALLAAIEAYVYTPPEE